MLKINAFIFVLEDERKTTFPLVEISSKLVNTTQLQELKDFGVREEKRRSDLPIWMPKPCHSSETKFKVF